MTTQFIFFSGKGGVGKTSMACTTAVRYADAGKRTLIVTTDPASNLSDVFEQPLGHAITSIAHVPNLWAMEIDADRATEEYKDRALAPIRSVFPAELVAVMEEQMSGPCTAEIAAFDRFTDFLEPPVDAHHAFDIVIFDTAPTGHTLRLIELPAEWSRSIETAAQGTGQTCIGPAAAIQDARDKYERAVATMRDSTRTTFMFVLHPEATSLKETQRAIDELHRLAIRTHQLIVNGIIPPEATTDELFAARQQMQMRYLEQIARDLPLPMKRMYLLDGEIKGVARLRTVGEMLFEGRAPMRWQSVKPVTAEPPEQFAPNPSIIRPRLLPNGQRRTIFFTGKGGVGKTVTSCVTAVWLARHGYKTLLLTTDPAAHIGDVLGVPVGDHVAPVTGVPNLWATKIDPKVAADAYRSRILDDARRHGRPEAVIKVMAEELDSPCTEEMAAFDQFIDYAAQSDWQVVVFDTAPTGHTLRLLELPVDWSRQIDVKVFASVEGTVADNATKQRFSTVIAMMRDPARSTFAFVMYPEATPILEAYRAVEELNTLGIAPGLVVANMVVPPEAATTPFAQRRRAMQGRYLAEMVQRFPVPILQLPLLPHEVRGLDMLQLLGERLYGNEAQ